MASIDRLSDLPDEILSHILSFLPIKTSVSTSTLAARWRFVWAYSPNIQIVDGSLSLHSIYDHSDILRIILPQCEAHGLNTLRILGDIFFDCELERFLESAVACKMKTLEITQTYDYCDLPHCVLTSQTLVDLKLSRFFIKMKNVTVCLPALKRLHFTTVGLQDGSLENLIFGCPVLEEFTGFNCAEDVVSHSLSSSTMKRLVLKSGTFYNKLKIDIPALDYLLMPYDFPQIFSVGPMDSLIGAHIFVRDDTLNVNGNLYSLVEFLGRFSNVKELSLCSWPRGRRKVRDLTPVDLNIEFHNLAKLTVEGDWRIISYFVEKANKLEVLNVRQYSEREMEETLQSPMVNSIMKLHNLIKLELRVDWWFLTYFLEKADKLKVLIIRNNVYRKQKRKRWLAAPLQVPNCLSSHLKIVEIHELNGTEHELDMVRYLLKNAKVLERMELHCLAESIGRISSFDRGSEKCEIVFNEYLESDSDDD